MAPRSDDELDRFVRLAAFRELERLTARLGNELPWGELRRGFTFEGQTIPWIGQQGICKPRFMHRALSITTSPKNPYSDEVRADGFIEYHYQGDDPMRYDNVAVREAGVAGAPLIYFHGIARGIYLAFWPAFIQHDDQKARLWHVAIDEPNVLRDDLTREVVDEVHRRYATRLARTRLHQAAFREQVLAAYGTRCTLCTLKHRALLDAAHILPDNHPDSKPVVPNGLALCKIHHSAFDANIIGIRPGANRSQHTAEVRGDILREIDGPMLQHGIQEMHGRTLWLPRNPENRPNPSFLEYRYEQFRAAS